LNIYIYGAKDFKNSVSTILAKSDIVDGVEKVNSLSRLQSVIQETPKEIFIIDESKIYQENFLNKKFSFLKPKDGIEKQFLDQHGVGDICFHSLEGIVTYLKSRLDLSQDSAKGVLDESHETIESLDDNEDIMEDLGPLEEVSEEASYKDLSEIEKIEEIEDFQMEEVVLELESKK
jgi:hypothetical protein